MSYTRIMGTGSYLPERVLTNHELASMVDTSHEWIIDRTGIHQRHIASENETTVSMAYAASLKALESANLSAQDIDLIIVATCTPDKFFPSCACLLHEKLAIQRSVVAFDVAAACSGFVYGLHLAHQLMQAGSVTRALVVGSDTMSRTVDWSDRSTCVLFADGAGAVVIERDQQPGIIHSQLYARGSQDVLSLPNPLAVSQESNKPSYMSMKGREVYKFSLEVATTAIEACIQAMKPQPLVIDWLIPHQANIRMLKPIADKLGVPIERVVITLDRHGNTSAASIPLALDQGIRQGKITTGQRLMLLAFGAGMTWGNVYLTL